MITLFSCKKSDESIDETVVFEISPVDTQYISIATPLGNLNPPDHTLPTNHVYFYFKDVTPVPVKAVAEGTIRQAYYNEWSDDYRIEIYHTTNFLYYYDHIHDIFPNVTEGANIVMGEILGFGHGGMDLGTVDYKTENNFIFPERYHEFYLYCKEPYQYFNDSIRTMLLAKNPRIIEPRGGKIDFDRDGYLSGNWFAEGTPLIWEASSYLYADNQIAFVYDMFDPLKVVISCGGTLAASPFAYKVMEGPDPAFITPSSGLVKYRLNAIFFDCTLLVLMVDNRRIWVEVFTDALPGDITYFSGGERVYVR